MKSLCKALILAALLALAATPAAAREYVVHTCKLPDGRPAPTDGWSANGSAPYMWFDDSCAQGGALSAGLAGLSQPANTSQIGWGFNSGAAPIRGYTIVRSGAPRGSTTGTSMLLFSSDLVNNTQSGHHIDYCPDYTGCTGIAGTLTRSVPAIPTDSHAWYLSLVCGGHAGWSCTLREGTSDFGSMRIDSASFRLDDPDPPSAGAVTGSLTRTDATSGSVRLTATDKISGLRRASIEVDGATLVSVTPENAQASCSEVGQSLLPDFTLRRPCPASSPIELTLPAGQLAPGVHSLRVRIYDAAGNGVTAFGPQNVVVPATEDPAPAGAGVSSLGAARFVPDRASALKANFGRRMWVSGVLVAADGTPLAGAAVTATLRAPAAAVSRRTIVVSTDSAGRYRVPIRALSNRSIALTHPASGAALAQRLTVHSRLRLRATTRRVRALGRMRLSGRIRSERTRRGGSVAIKVRNGRSWRTVGVVKADRNGHFSFGYRFRRTRRASFVFRAVALRSTDLAVTPSPSNHVRVRVG